MQEPRSVPPLFDLTSARPETGGAWCWFQDERAVVDEDAPGGPLLLASTVGFGPEGADGRGAIDLLWRNLATGETGAFTLHEGMPLDDHNSGALYVREDGRCLAVYAKHAGEQLIRSRVSVDPHDPTRWSPERVTKHAAEVCYSNVVPAGPGGDEGEGGEHLLNFVRSSGYDPNRFVSEDGGETWSYAGKLLTGPDGNDADRQRPYVKYVPGPGGSVHFLTTSDHPAARDTGVYHGVLAGGELFDSAGEPLGSAAPDDRSPHRSTDFTPLLEPGQRFGGVPMHHGWTVDLAVDAAGHPRAIFTARANGDDRDHRFFFARHDGDRWAVREFARAGGYLYDDQRDYTGLAALHPHDPDRLFVSTTVDPRDDRELERYELFSGVTADGGGSWAWTPVTWASDEDNTRPVVPRRPGGDTVLLWLRGTCHTYEDWDARVVGFTASPGQLRGLGVPNQATVTRPAVPPDAGHGG